MFIYIFNDNHCFNPTGNYNIIIYGAIINSAADNDGCCNIQPNFHHRHPNDNGGTDYLRAGDNHQCASNDYSSSHNERTGLNEYNCDDDSRSRRRLG